MDVQAHHSSNAFSHNFSSRIQSNALIDELHLIHNTNSNREEMTMTGNGSVSKKRIRDDEPPMMAMMMPRIYANLDGHVADPIDQTRLVESAAASTSGLRYLDLVAHLYNQSVEIDALIRLQNERLRLGMEERQKRHCRSLVSIFEHHLQLRLREKETELENAMRKNSELEERAQQMSVQSQIWFNIARNNEAVAANLKASLEQVLLQNDNAAAVTSIGVVGAKEGYGDSDGTAAESCCYEGIAEERKSNGAVRGGCRLCGGRDVSVLLLPCRHLCLCSSCGPKANTCPVCHVSRKASLLVFMS